MAGFDQWLLKAEHDLKSAVKLSEGEDPVLDTAVYHAQQCAEKALKAYLTFRKTPFEKVHDLRLLVERCAELDIEFAQLREAAETLTPYATVFRYPDEVILPDKEDVISAVALADRVLAFVKAKCTVA